MSSPRALIQVLIAGTQILGKAFIAAGRQAYKNAQHIPQGGSLGDAAGVSNATSGSITDKLTREHKMTLDEARLVLNVRKEETMETILKRYEHLFKANSLPPPEKPVAVRAKPHYYSHYLQSKVVRAKERIEAEVKASLPEAESSTTSASQSQSTTSSTSPQSGNPHSPPSS